MAYPGRPAAKQVAELIGSTIDPLVRKRGLARAELISWWPDIVGEAYAPHTTPERIRWPRDGGAATLFVRCDPAMALQFSYEADRVRERLNGYFGYPAVSAVRIVQRTTGRQQERPAADSAPKEMPAELEERLDRIEGPLGDSLRALGRSILAGS
jgi:hypothetical protein